MNKLVIKALNKLRLLNILNLQTKVKVNGQIIRVPIIRSIGLDNVYGTEPWMIQLLTQIFKFRNEGAYYDIGVNLGQTLIKVKSVNSEIEYLGFEPNPSCVFYTRELIKANSYKKTTLFPVGISNENSIYSLSLFTDDDTDSAGSIVENFRPHQTIFRKQFIPCFNIQKIFEKYELPKIGILKIDVEGAEKEVLESFEIRIKQDKPLIQIEILPVYSEGNLERLNRQNAIEEFVKKIDYSIFRVGHTTDNNDFNRLEEIKTIGIHSNMKWCEYLLVPNSETVKFKHLS